MGIGPVPAVEGLLKVTDKTLQDIDIVEVRMVPSRCISNEDSAILNIALYEAPWVQILVFDCW